MKLVLMAAMGGAIGSAGRYLISVGAFRVFGAGFPWGTLIVNVSGSLIMGLLVSTIAQRFAVSNEIRTLLMTGILGGFTTFSVFSLDFAVLMERKAHGLAMAYLCASVGLSILALFAGLYIARAVLQ